MVEAGTFALNERAGRQFSLTALNQGGMETTHQISNSLNANARIDASVLNQYRLTFRLRI